MSIRLFRMHVRVPIVVLASIEAALFFFAPFLAARIRQVAPHDVPDSGIGVTACFFTVYCVSALFAVGMYSTRQRSNLAGLVVRITVGILFASALSALTFYLVPQIQFDRRTLALTAGIALLCSFIARLLFERTVDQDMFKSRVLVYGAGRLASSVLALRRRADQRGFKLVGFMATPGDQVRVPPERIVPAPTSLFDFALEHDVDEIVVAMDDRRQGFPLHEFIECRLAGIGVLELPSFLERETGRVHLDILNPSWIIFADGFGGSQAQRALAAVFDVLVSTLLLVLASPLLLFTMLAIKIEDGWHSPVFYRQQRVGKFNKRFDVIKFRSMGVDAEAGGAQWAVANDPRVTWVGGWLRKTRIDELPQLWNVLCGDMSFVGPRPERPEFVDTLEQKIPYYRERHTVKPGITGWAQLCYPYGSSEKDALEKLQYDLFYVKNRSLLFDLAILLQTVEVVLWGKGAR